MRIFVGVPVYLAAALAIWLCSRWVLLPGLTLPLFFGVAALMFSLAVLWPEDQVNRAVTIALGFCAFEAKQGAHDREPKLSDHM